MNRKNTKTHMYIRVCTYNVLLVNQISCLRG